MNGQFDANLLKRAADEFSRQAGILGMGVDKAPKMARAIVNASFHNADFSTRIWANQGQLRNELSILLSNGIVQGIHSRELAKQIEKKFGVSKSNAERLMRTEMARVQIAAQEESYRANGYEQYVFLAIGTACPGCLALNEQHFNVADMQSGENAPPMHPNCRCSTAAWMDRAETMKQIKAMSQIKADVKEESLRTKDNGDYGVDWKTVKSKEYTERFNQLSDNAKANALVAQRARNALKNRDGKNTEEIYAVNMTIGKDVSSITNQNYVKGIRRTEKFIQDIKRAEENGDRVLLIHNHPSSSTPSLADINELLSHDSVSGITVGHNGNIYYYTRPSSIISKSDFRVALLKNKGYNVEKQYEDTLFELAKKFNFEFKIL